MMIERYPWLRDTYQPLEKNIRAHKNPHALLIQGNLGIGRLALTKFLSNIFLGFEGDQESEIKDEIIVSPIDNKKSVSIDQIRSLKQSLLLTSLKGKGKVGIIYLSVFGNRPVLLNDIGHEYLTNQIDSLSKQITGLIDGQTKPSDISDSWKTEDIEINLRVIYSWMFKYLEIRLLRKNDDDNLPNGLSRMLDQNINHESCFKLMDDIIRLRELKYSGKGLSWNIHVTKLLNPLFTDMSGLKEYA